MSFNNDFFDKWDGDITTLKPLYTVSQINRLSRELLEHQLGQVCIEGEISNFMQPSSGHAYFSLKDANAQLRCAMFKNRNRELLFKPKEGMQVIATGILSVYEARGDYQLIIEKLEEAGLGDLQKAFAALKKQLQAAGFFDPAHKQKVPAFPRCVGIVTSPTGAAIRDILHVSRRRFPGISIIIYPVAVQGGQAKFEIQKAIQIANRRKECDVLIVGRGGGSLEDLWPFNEMIVAQAIFDSHIPIVSAVGHEIDFTIADFVSDLRAPTPSAAAEMVFPEREHLIQQLRQYFERLYRHLIQVVRHENQRIALLKSQIKHPTQILRENMQRIDTLELRLIQQMKATLKQYQHRLSLLQTSLVAYHPQATLSRGYCLVSKVIQQAPIGLALVTRASQLQINDQLRLQFADDVIEAFIPPESDLPSA